MGRSVLGAVALVLWLSFSAGSEERYAVSGTVAFQEAELVFLALYTREQFSRFRNNPLPPPPFSVVVEPGVEEKKAGLAPFRFEGIPRGTYALMAFRDKKVQGVPSPFGKFASEYIMKTFSGQWEEVKIEVYRNLGGIEIRFD